MRLRPAERVLHELGINQPQEIDVEAIAWYLGAVVKYRPLSTCEARIVGTASKAIICVDDRKSPERVRFSIGHELGHWMHHRGRCLICRSDEIGDRSRGPMDPERVADGYAADLLMPEYLFKPLTRGVKNWNLAAIRDIASTFNTSLTATAIRLCDLDFFPGMVVCHSPEGREWFARPRSVPERWFPRADLDADSQAFSMLHGSEPEARFPRRIGADAWFDRHEAARFEVKEQSFRVPEGIVTLLLLDSEMLT